jgi:tetratricopeptide (TPR) repeat protein
LFEVFHDVQYLSLVWIYNRNRVEKDKTIGGFMRFVFRRSGALVGLYVGLVFAYGSFAYLNSQLEIDNVKRLLTGVVAASGLLHFYYDGFIWKVRESSTRASLGLGAGTADILHKGVLRGWALHGAKWVAGFVIPVGLLCIWQMRTPISDVEKTGRIVAAVPTSVSHRFDYGAALQEAGQRDQAMQEFQWVLANDPSHSESHYHVALLLGDEAKFDPALNELDKAIQLEPKNGEFRFQRAETLRRIGRNDEALQEYHEAARLRPKTATAHFASADLLASRGDLPGAIMEYRAGLHAKPNDITGHLRLAQVLANAEQFDAARAECQAALRLNPNLATAHNSLGTIWGREGQMEKATAEFSEAARLDPNDRTFAENLRMAREAIGQGTSSP